MVVSDIGWPMHRTLQCVVINLMCTMGGMYTCYYALACWPKDKVRVNY